MAKLPRCSSCIYRKNTFGTICEYYSEGIPKDILVENQFCWHYQMETKNIDHNIYNDLPTAKGI